MGSTSLVQDVTRATIEDFLYAEAALLDEWRLQEWLDLLTEDATYEVPSTDTPDGDARTTLFIIADNIERIRSRVRQLLGKSAWAENPPSRTRRLISNVRIRDREGDTIRVTANFVVYRMRFELVDTYMSDGMSIRWCGATGRSKSGTAGPFSTSKPYAHTAR
jgi:p-cumate 2,3-dioxygenase beta subunit